MFYTTVGTRVRVEIAIESCVCYVEADANQFETALINMVVNARDAMNGEGQLTIKAACNVMLDQRRFVAISVADTGQGIPADRLERIFEPFYTTKGVGKGTGLGLSQVYGFAKQSGGEVRVTSDVGCGTVFTLYLPQVEGRGVVAAEPEVVAGSGVAQGRILLVEDNEQVGEMAAQLLDDLGYTITRASDAASALALIEAGSDGFDLVFSDVVMPGEMSGVDLARILRQRSPTLPVVLTTGFSEALADGTVEGVELLRKPYSVESLSYLLRRKLHARR